MIALFTGVRRAEIAGLYVDDIHNVTQIDRANGQPIRGWVFDFNERNGDKRLKTHNG